MSNEQILQLHRQAMDLTDQAFAAKSQGALELAMKLFEQALSRETEAATLAISSGIPEPTKSVLLRSAATLALDCGRPRVAEKLVSMALSADPPESIAMELRDIYETVNLSRHLLLRGVTLDHSEFQMSLAGNAVGFGVALTSEFLERIENVCRLVRRTVERKLGKPFQETGRPAKTLIEEYGVFMSVPRGASFAVSLRVAQPSGQRTMPGVLEESAVIDDLLIGLECVEKNDEQSLRSLIKDDAYFRHFLNAAKALAPDGDDISLVGFTSAKKSVAMRRKRECLTIQVSPQTTVATSEVVTQKISGRLKYADSRKQNQIRLIDDKGTEHLLIVPKGMMNDIVKPLWDSDVEILARQVGKDFEVVDIAQVRLKG